MSLHWSWTAVSSKQVLNRLSPAGPWDCFSGSDCRHIWTSAATAHSVVLLTWGRRMCLISFHSVPVVHLSAGLSSKWGSPGSLRGYQWAHLMAFIGPGVSKSVLFFTSSRIWSLIHTTPTTATTTTATAATTTTTTTRASASTGGTTTATTVHYYYYYRT